MDESRRKFLRKGFLLGTGAMLFPISTFAKDFWDSEEVKYNGKKKDPLEDTVKNALYNFNHGLPIPYAIPKNNRGLEGGFIFSREGDRRILLDST